MLGVPSEGAASSNPQKSLSLKGFAKRNAEDLVHRGLAMRDAGGGIVPMTFVSQQMLDAYERERKFFRAGQSSYENAETNPYGADNAKASGQRSLSVGDAARQLRVTMKTMGYLIEHGMLRGVDTSELYRRGATLDTADSLTQFQESFIFLGALAEVMQCPKGSLSMKLRNVNVALLAIPHDLSRIYWRADVGADAKNEK